jgi:SAM-dependent methyltransferase
VPLLHPPGAFVTACSAVRKPNPPLEWISGKIEKSCEIAMPISDPTIRFSDRVDNYVRYRPGYPPAVLEVLKYECGLKPSSVVADVASGTGVLTRMFLENGNRVYAVEPNPEMRHAGERLLTAYTNFNSVATTAESTSLPAHSIDFVTAAQAAHWFDLARARAEFVRILKPEGWCVLLWNERCIDSTPFLRAYEQIVLEYGTDYKEVRHERTTAAIGSFFAPSKFHSHVFEIRQEFDYPALEGRLLSSSYAPQSAHQNYAPTLKALRAVFDEYKVDGHVTFEYNTRMFYGQLA